MVLTIISALIAIGETSFLMIVLDIHVADFVWFITLSPIVPCLLSTVAAPLANRHDGRPDSVEPRGFEVLQRPTDE